MLDYFYNENQSAKQEVSHKPEIPGMSLQNFLNREWQMYFKIFDLTDEEDIEQISKIYTESTKTNKNSGTMIFQENGRFFEDGTFRMMVRWGEWTTKEDVNKTGPNLAH